MERPVLGLTEKIKLLGVKQEEVMARIDSGATASSVDINLAQRLNLGPVTRKKIVKSASGVKERPMVEAEVKINNITIRAEFTLADRDHMTYPVLIGQNILKKGKFLIDPLKK